MTEKEDPIFELHFRFTQMEYAVERAIQELRLGKDPEDVADKLQDVLEYDKENYN